MRAGHGREMVHQGAPGGDFRVLDWQNEMVQIRFRRHWGVHGYANVPMEAPIKGHRGPQRIGW